MVVRIMCLVASYNMQGGEPVNSGNDLISSDGEQYVLDGEL